MCVCVCVCVCVCGAKEGEGREGKVRGEVGAAEGQEVVGGEEGEGALGVK